MCEMSMWVYSFEIEISQSIICSALTRPGRFDTRITIPMPDIRARYKILQVHSEKIELDKGESSLYVDIMLIQVIHKGGGGTSV